MPKISLFKIVENRIVFISTLILSIIFLSSCSQNTDTEQITEVELRLDADLSNSTEIELYLFRQNYLEQPELIDSINTNSNKSISLSVNPQDLFLLQAKNQQLQTLLFLDADEVTVTVNDNSLQIKGGEQNNYLNDYLEKTKYFQLQLEEIRLEFEQNSLNENPQQIMILKRIHDL